MGKEFALVIPLYLILIGFEAVYGAYKNMKLYRLNDTISNLNTGLLSVIYGFTPKAAHLVIYIYFYEHFRIADFPKTWWAFLIFLISTDFCVYWFHRFSHEVNFIWASHKVHHQSEEFNMSVALRQSANGLFPAVFFFLPAAILGVDPISFGLMTTINLVYQFTIHTKVIKKFPKVIEYVFCTPSHHRVHHAMNPKYLDKNYAGIFILWDRIFGTFQVEEEAEIINYGITQPFNSWNPLWANVEHFTQIWKTMKLVPNWSQKLRVIFDKPGWMPKELGGEYQPQPREKNYVSYNPKVDTNVNLYVLFQFVISLSLFVLVYFKIESFPKSVFYLVFGGLLSWTFINNASMLDGKRWSWVSDVFKCLVAPLFIGYIFKNQTYFEELFITFFCCNLISLIWLFQIKKYFKVDFQRLRSRFDNFINQ